MVSSVTVISLILTSCICTAVFVPCLHDPVPVSRDDLAYGVQLFRYETLKIKSLEKRMFEGEI